MPSSIEDNELMEIFHMLNSKAEIPSACTLSHDIQEVFLLTKNVLAMLKVSHSFTYQPLLSNKSFKVYPGKLHIGLDRWMALNINSFLGLVVYLIHDVKMFLFVFNFVK